MVNQSIPRTGDTHTRETPKCGYRISTPTRQLSKEMMTWNRGPNFMKPRRPKAKTKFIIYCLKDPTTQTIYYVGASKRGTERPRGNLRARGIGPELRGQCFEILECLNSPDLLSEREGFWIHKLVTEGHTLQNKWKNPNHLAMLKAKRILRIIRKNL